jgi:uncharacterized protein (TIGR02246 family)
VGPGRMPSVHASREEVAMPIPRPPFRLAAAVLVLSALMIAHASRAATPGAREAAEVRAVLAEQLAAWNHGDLEGFMAGYWHSDSLSFFSGGDISHGWQTTHDRYQRRYRAEGREMGTLTFDILDVQVLAKDVAIVKGGWALAMKDGAPSGLFTLVLRKRQGEGWRIVHDHTSVAAAK